MNKNLHTHLLVCMTAFLMLPLPIFAQMLSDYSFQAANNTYIPVSQGLTVGCTRDDSYGTVTLPFDFKFAETLFPQGENLYVCSNGYITFNYSSTSRTPSFTSNYSFISPLGHDLNPGASGTVTYEVSGQSPNRTLTVEWANIAAYNTNNRYNFQVKLHETTNAIEFCYGQMTVSSSKNPIVALYDRQNNQKMVVTGNGNWEDFTVSSFSSSTSILLSSSSYPAQGLVYTFTPPVVTCPGITGVNFREVTYNSAVVQWTACDSADRYEVVLSYSSDMADAVSSFADSTSYVLENLRSNTLYYVKVRAICGEDDTSRWSAVASVRTPISCASVMYAGVKDVNRTKALVKWQLNESVGREASAVLVEYKSEDETDWHTFNTALNYCHLAGLSSGAAYTVKLSTLCDNNLDTAETKTLTFATPMCGEISGNTTSVEVPFQYNYGYGYSQTIYPASVLSGMDTITGISFYVNNRSYVSRKIDVYIGNTSMTTLSTSNHVSVSNMEQKASDYMLDVSSVGWVTIPFSTPFIYDGSSNVVVAVDNNTGNWDYSLRWRAHNAAEGNSVFYYSNTNIDPASPQMSGSTTTTVPDIRFHGNCNASVCAAPLVLITDRSASSVDLVWASGASENQWQVEYKRHQDADWTVADTTADTTYSVTLLQHSIQYDFRVGSLCGAQPRYSATLSAWTECDVETAPYREDFNLFDSSHPCWTEYMGTVSDTVTHIGQYFGSNWQFSNSRTMNGISAGLAMASSYYRDWLITPEISLGGLADPALTFDLALTAFSSSSAPDTSKLMNARFMVLVSLDGGATWNTNTAVVWANRGTGHYSFNRILNVGEQVSIPLAQYAGQTVRIAFYLENSYNHSEFGILWIDNIEIGEAPDCLRPKNVTADNITWESAGISWPACEEADAYQIAYCAQDVAYSDIDRLNQSTRVMSVSASKTLTGLRSETGYYVWVRSIVGTDTTGWSPNTYFKTTESCAKVETANVSEIGYDNALLTWTFNETVGQQASSVRIDYKLSSERYYTTHYATGNTFRLTDLASSSYYDVRIYTLCANDSDTSEYKSLGFRTTESCAKVDNALISDISHTEALLTWDYNETVGKEPSSVLIDYKATGETGWTSAATSGNYHFFTGLDEGTSYEVRIRTLCDNGQDTSSIETLTFATPMCGEISGNTISYNVPFQYNYNYGYSQTIYPASVLSGMDTITGISFYVNNRSYVSRKIDVYIGNTSMTTLSTSNHVSVSNMEQKASDYMLDVSSVGWVTIPFSTPFIYDGSSNVVVAVDNNTGNWDYSLRWRAHNAAEGNSVFYFSYTNIDPASPQVSGSTTTTVPDIRFLGNCNLNTDCTVPVLLVTGKTEETLDLAWTPGTANNAWKVEYKISADRVWTSAGIVHTANHTLTGLLGSTLYDVRIGRICGTDTVYSAVKTVWTDCGVVPAPLREDFTAFNPFPPCWNRLSGDIADTAALTPTEAGWQFNNSYVFGNGHAALNLSSGAAYYWLVSPEIDFSTLTSPYLSFDLALTQHNYAAPIQSNSRQNDDRFMVVVSADNGATWDWENAVIWDNTGNGNYTFNNIASVGEQIEIQLTGYDSQTARIAFYGESAGLDGYYNGGDNDLHLDNVFVGEMPPCLIPGGLSASNITWNSATIQWTACENADSYEIAYSKNNYIDNGVIVTSVNSVKNLSGLNDDTRYYVWVRTIAGTDTTRWSSYVTFKTTVSCAKVQDLRTTAVSYNSANIAWQYDQTVGLAPTGVLISYKMYDEDDWTTDTTSRNSFILDGLASSSYYSVAVRTVCAYGLDTSVATIVSFETDPSCAPLKDAVVADVSYNNALVTWTVDEFVGRPSSSVLISYKAQGDTTWRTLSTEENYIFLTGLDAGASYVVSLRNLCAGDSDTARVQTLYFSTAACGQITGTENTSYLPFNGNFNYGYSQIIYSADELAGLDTITGISFYVDYGSRLSRTVDVYMGHTSRTTLSKTDYIAVDDLQQKAVDYTLDISTAGWVTIPFSTPFVYDGSSNVVVAVDNNTGSYSSFSWRAHQSLGTNAVCWYSDNTNINPLAPSAVSGFETTVLPDIRFHGNCIQPTCVAPMPLTRQSTLNSVDLVWMPGYQDTLWTVEYMRCGDSLWHTAGSTQDTLFTVDSLASSSNYWFRIGSICGTDTLYSRSVSAWTGCDMVSIPYEEGFNCSSLSPCITIGTFGSVSSLPELYYGGRLLMRLDNFIILPEIEDGVNLNELQISFFLEGYKSDVECVVAVGENPYEIGNFVIIDTVRTFHLGDQGTSSPFFEVSLEAYNGNGGFIALIMSNLSLDYMAILDDIVVDYRHDCTAPTDLAVVAATDTSLSLSWNGRALNYEIAYRPTGSDAWSSVSTVDNRIVLNGLAASSYYEIKMRSFCFETDTSEWSDTWTVVTDCAPFTITRAQPYDEDFNAVRNLLADCWESYSDVASDDVSVYPIVISDVSGVLSADSTKLLVMKAGSQETGYLKTALLPRFYNDLDTLELEFYVRFEDTLAGELTVGYMHNDTFVEFSQIPPTLSGSTVTVDLSTIPVVPQQRLAFRWYNMDAGNQDYLVGIDNVVVRLREPECHIPTDVTAAIVTTDAVLVQWTENGTATEWIVEYGLHGFTQGTGAVDTLQTISSFILTDLDPGTSYDMYVKSICSSTNVSAWSAPVTFTTLTPCYAPERFMAAAVGTDSIIVRWAEVGDATEWQVEYGPQGFVPGQGTVRTTAETSCTLTGLQPGTSYDFYVRAVCDSTETSEWTGPLTETTPPVVVPDTCHAPADIAAAVLSGDSVRVSWTEAGDATEWQVEYGLQGFVPGQGTVRTTAETSCTLTGLQPGTSYDFYVRAVCDSTETSEWTGPLTETTPPVVVPDTCHAPQNLAVSDIAVNSVTLNWEQQGDPDSWTLYFRKGTEVWTTVSTTMPSPYALTDLAPESNYEAYVTAVCDDTESTPSNIVAFTTLPDGIVEFVQEQTKVYPNPASSSVTVANDNCIIEEMALYNAYGQLIYTQQVNGHRAVVQVQELASGIYFVRVVTDKGTTVKPFAKR